MSSTVVLVGALLWLITVPLQVAFRSFALSVAATIGALFLSGCSIIACQGAWLLFSVIGSMLCFSASIVRLAWLIARQ